jgi:hypothetical protein
LHGGQHNDIVVLVSIPDFDADGDLPPGVHEADWKEFEDRFGYTDHRRRLLNGLRRALASLRRAGCTRVYVDGSFITTKHTPADFDACWDEAGVDPDVLEPVLLMFDYSRAAQKAVYGGEFFPWSAPADGRSPFREFFQTTRLGKRKGVVLIDLERWQP